MHPHSYKLNKDHQRIMVDPIFKIVQNLRLFLTAVAPTAAINLDHNGTVWTVVVPFWIYFGPIWIVLKNIWLYWTILIILDHIVQFWTDEDDFEQFWIILDHFLPFWTILKHFGQYLTIFDHFKYFGPFLGNLDHYGS